MLQVLPEDQRDPLCQAAESVCDEHWRTSLHALFDQAPLVVFLLSGPDLTFEYCNRRCIQLLDGRDLTGQRFREAVPRLSQQLNAEGTTLTTQLERVFSSGETLAENALELRIICRPDSSASPTAFFNTVYQPTRGPDGQVQGLLVFALEVTEQVRAQREVEQLARQAADRATELEALIEHMPSGVMVIDTGGRVQLHNSAARHIAGCQGQNGLDIDALAAAYRVRDPRTGAPLPVDQLPVKRALRGEDVHNFEYLITRPRSAREHAIQSSAVSIRDAAGKLRGALVVFSDVTNERRLVRELAASETRYRTLIDTATEGLWTVDVRGNTVFINQRMARMLGYSVDEIINRSILDFLDDTATVDCALNYLRREQFRREIHDFRFRRKDGSDLWVLASVSPIYNDRNELAGALGMVTDITARKRAERALSEREEQLHQLFEQSPLGIMLIDARGVIIDANPVFAGFVGAPIERIIGFDLITGPHERALVPLLERAMSGERVSAELPYTSEAGNKSGHYRYIFQPIMLEGRLSYILGLVEDIAERKRAEAEIERLNAMKDEFLAVAAHELRTPVATMMAFSQLALRHVDGDTDPRVRRALEVTSQQCARMKHLINEMLDISRIQAGTLELDLHPLDLAQLVSEVVERMRALSTRHPLRLETPPGPMPFRGDPSRLEQVLTNLLSNAIKYSPDGGEIQVRLSRDARYVRISVVDRGVGIPDEAQPRIFERFFRVHTDQSTVIEGLGLGLTIAQDIVRRHGGEISLRSEEGQGSTFTVHLPLEGR